MQKHEKSGIYISKLVASVKVKSEAGNWGSNPLWPWLDCCHRNPRSLWPYIVRRNWVIPEDSREKSQQTFHLAENLWCRDQLVLYPGLKASRFTCTPLTCCFQSNKQPPDLKQQQWSCLCSLHHRGNLRAFPGKNGLDMTSPYKKVQKVLFSLQARSKTHFEIMIVIVKWIHCLPASSSQLVGLQFKKRVELL